MNPISFISAAPYLLIVFLLASGGSYFYGRSDGKDMAEAQGLREERLSILARDEALRVTGQAIAGISVKHTVIQQKVEKEIYEKPVYRDCRHDPDSLRLINAALTGQSNEPPGLGKLPRLDATK